jgi:hypothetical protein
MLRRPYNSSIKENINNILKKIKYNSIEINEIKIRFGLNTLNIDYLIDKGDYIIAIYNNWKETSITLNDNTNFIKSVEHILKSINKPMLVIYLSKCVNNTTNNNFKDILSENGNNYVLKYNTIYSNTPESLIKKLKKVLYENEIYMYDSDGDALMLY